MGNWHSTSHNDPKGGGGQQMIKVQAFMAKEFLYFISKLKSYADGGLLAAGQHRGGADHPERLQHPGGVRADGSPQAELPADRGGRRRGAWKTGRVIDVDGRDHNDVYLSIAKAFGMNVTTVGNAAWCKGPAIT